jgi:S1-C subfamily serine protease
LLPACLLGAAALLLAPAAGAASWCLDAERDVVTPPLPTGCSGRVVDDAEAAEARMRRIERVKRAVGGGPAAPTTPGGRGGERRLAGVGTGFFITGDGKALSNNHVVERCTEITVNTAEAPNQPARVVAVAPEADLALIDTAAAAPAFAAFRAGGQMQAGSDVALVGFPTQGMAPIVPLMTQGSLLGLDPAEASGGLRTPRLVFKADVRGGNSGGPLYDTFGLVIGVVFGEIDTPKVYRRTGKTVVDVGFAIPGSVASQFLARHGVKPTAASPGAALGPAELQAQANRQVVRVNCWR